MWELSELLSQNLIRIINIKILQGLWFKAVVQSNPGLLTSHTLPLTRDSTISDLQRISSPGNMNSSMGYSEPLFAPKAQADDTPETKLVSSAGSPMLSFIACHRAETETFFKQALLSFDELVAEQHGVPSDWQEFRRGSAAAQPNQLSLGVVCFIWSGGILAIADRLGIPDGGTTD